MATMDDVKALLTSQASCDPRQTLHNLRALVFAKPAAAPKVETTSELEPEKRVEASARLRKPRR